MMRRGTPKGKENAVAALLELCRGGGAFATQRVLRVPALASLLQTLLFTGTKRARWKDASLARVCQRMAPKVARKMPTTRGKRILTTSLRKRLNDEREDPSHPNYNNPPRIPGKRRKTCSTRVPLRDSSISGSLPRVSVTPEQDSSQDSSAVESSSSDS
ncbi:hypothetical protein GIB67_023162 [Kingdonia uniflora]|uniref:Uncharacterized protein n=1 Tax=Kingdonia uniflora TaxID=39325 RepID=A0A7J7M5Q5_9MAGN|nr:hypothetical protein GIB67_023162 [Kingdonia uniflora]